jgi:predicted  nucleic acid-binding Zn-ribbon protein
MDGGVATAPAVIPAPEDQTAKQDFRQMQVRELERLQMTLDENNAIRAKFNALQTQVAPLVDNFVAAPTITHPSEREYTPEEIETMKQKLEQTLSDYREETCIAGRLNSEIEKRYTELSNMRMRFRLDQDERLTKQNTSASIGLANFRVKSVKLTETSTIERERLAHAVGYLQHIFDSSTQDIKGFEEQSRSNHLGIQQLSASISITKEDIREFSDQLQRLQPKLREYEILKEKHQTCEELVVKLGDEYENLKKQVETESLTASIRREIEAGNRTIADLNRTLDQILNKTSLSQEKIAVIRSRINELESKIAKTRAETAALRRTKPILIAEKERLKRELSRIRTTHETIAGDNELIERDLRDGLAYEKEPWQIRKEVLGFKGEIRALNGIESKQNSFESSLGRSTSVPISLPPRKRVRLIPLAQNSIR